MFYESIEWYYWHCVRPASSSALGIDSVPMDGDEPSKTSENDSKSNKGNLYLKTIQRLVISTRGFVQSQIIELQKSKNPKPNLVSSLQQVLDDCIFLENEFKKIIK